MKKRLVAVMLGLTLSLATVGEAGAAAFSSPDSEMVQAEMTETENTDVFSAGDGDEQDAQTDDADHIQAEFSSDAEDELYWNSRNCCNRWFSGDRGSSDCPG